MYLIWLITVWLQAAPTASLNMRFLASELKNSSGFPKHQKRQTTDFRSRQGRQMRGLSVLQDGLARATTLLFSVRLWPEFHLPHPEQLRTNRSQLLQLLPFAYPFDLRNRNIPGPAPFETDFPRKLHPVCGVFARNSANLCSKRQIVFLRLERGVKLLLHSSGV